MVHTRSSVAEAPVNLEAPSYSLISSSSSRKMSLRPVRPSVPDSSINYAEASTSESSPSPSLSSDSTTPLDMMTTSTPEPSSSPELTSSPRPSGTPETSPTSTLPTDQLCAIQIKKSQVAAAKGVEAAARRELSKRRVEGNDHRQSARNQRQKAKDLETDLKKLRAKVNGLKAAAQDHEKNAKRLNSLLPDLEEGVDEARDRRMRFQSELADLQYDEMLSERYPDLVIRRLVKRMDEDEELAETFHNFQQGDLRLDELEALEAQLDVICEEISNEKADKVGSESGELEQDIEEAVEGDEEADLDVKMASNGGVESGKEFERQEDHEREERGNEDKVLKEDGGMPKNTSQNTEDRHVNPPAVLCQGDQILSTNDFADVLVKEDTCRNDGAGVSVKAEPELDAETDTKDMSLKLEVEVKHDADKEEDGLGNLTEPMLRKRLRNAKAILQDWQAQARHFTGGKRKRDFEDYDD